MLPGQTDVVQVGRSDEPVAVKVSLCDARRIHSLPIRAQIVQVTRHDQTIKVCVARNKIHAIFRTRRGVPLVSIQRDLQRRHHVQIIRVEDLLCLTIVEQRVKVSDIACSVCIKIAFGPVTIEVASNRTLSK